MGKLTLEKVIGKLIEIISEYTKIEKDEIDIYEYLAEIGIDSIIYTGIRDEIKKSFGVEISFSKLYKDLNTIYNIAEYILDSMDNCQDYNDVYKEEAGDIDKEQYAEENSSFEEIAVVYENMCFRHENLSHEVNNLGITKETDNVLDCKIVSELVERSEDAEVMEFPLTKEQESILAQSEMSVNNLTFNEAVALEIKGKIDVDILNKSLEIVVKRHEALRTIIDKDNKKQIILSSMPTDIEVVEKNEKLTAQIIENIVSEAFSIKEKLFRVKLIKESDKQWILIFVVHHIIADGWSIGVLFSEMKEIYNSYFTGQGVRLNVPIQFREYIRIKDNILSLSNSDKVEDFWKRNASKTENYIDLCMDFAVRKKGFTGERYEFAEDMEMIKQLRKFSAKNHTSFFNTMLSLFMTLLRKVTMSENLSVGVPFAGQNIINAENLIGNCVEMIGVNLELKESESVNDILSKVKKYLDELEEVGCFADENSDKNYNVVFNMIRRPIDYNLYETEIEYLPVTISESKYDLFVSVLEFGDKLNIRFDYNKYILSKETISRWVTYFRTIMKSVLAGDNDLILGLNIIPEEETEFILNNFSAFKYEYVNKRLRGELSIYGLLENEDVRVFILDSNMQLAGIGILGEIYVGSNEVEIYNTNKMGRILENGELIVLGEEERQIQINGRNVSLFFIEERLKNSSKIEDAICEYDHQNRQIKAYVVEKARIASRNEIVSELKKELPAFMIPDEFIRVSDLMERNNEEIIENKEELTKTEEKMLALWIDILKTKNISIEDNFFDLGGNSIKAMKLISKIQSEFNKKVSIKDLFEYPTIKKLSDILVYINTYNSKVNRIVNLNYSSCYDTSSVQKRLYALHKLDKESLNYNVPFAMIINGDLEKEKVEQVFNRIIERHESLRTYYEEVDGKVVQKIEDDFRIKINYEEKSDGVEEKDFIDKKIKEFIKPFCLNKLPLIRVELIKVEEYKYFILIDLHHIIFDGASSVVLLKEFATIYEGNELPELEFQYKDYAAWINEYVKSDEMKRQEEYWKNVFNEDPPVLEIRTDFNRPANQTFKGQNISFSINEEVSRKIDELCKAYNVTPFMFFLSSVNILLSKYSRQEDIVIGTVVEGRSNSKAEDIIGMFVNTIPMRNKPVSKKTFAEFLKEVKYNTLGAFENSDYQFEDIVELIDVSRDASRNPMFDVMFVFQNNQVREMNIENLVISSLEIKPESSRLDLSFEMRREHDSYRCNIEFNTDLFKIETIKRLQSHFDVLLSNILNNVNEKICDIDILDDTEKERLIFEFNNTKVDYPKDKTIQKMFEEQVERTPDNTAVIFNDKKLTYNELNQKANQLARILRKKGVSPDSLVGIMVERSIEMIIGILGILKAGGGYLPININYPDERIEYILKDSGVKKLLVTDKVHLSIDYDGEIIDLTQENAYDADKSNLENLNVPENIAYIIYTSGTTGKPKGAILEHKNVIRLFFNDKPKFDFNQNDIWTMFHSYCFDFSVWEMYGALLYGGKLVIVPESIAKDPKSLLNMLIEENVTILNQTPSAFYNLSNEVMMQKENGLAIRYVIFGGEELKPRKLREWKEKYPDTKLINMYGITETTVHVTYKELTMVDLEEGISNIGKPIPTLTTYILDSDMRLSPLGVPGELCVSGEGLARGYLNRQDLTEEKFIPNPFIHGEKMYRSGDLARWLPNGDMEYLGRIDHQVKIRGHRIELGEIEATLNEYYAVKDSIVTIKKGVTGDNSLVAYVIPEMDMEEVEFCCGEDEDLEQMGQWEEVFNGVYCKETGPKDLKFNIVGWDSSYTGKPIPEEEMAEWLYTTVSRILHYKPNRVLEVGCGTGMLVYRIAPDCIEYCATDLSAEAIKYVEKVIQQDSTIREKVSLVNASADDFSKINGKYDFAILNSIIQYFPSVEYFVSVLEKTINVLKPGSTLFIGDIRNYSLLEAFHTSIALAKSSYNATTEDLRYHIEKNMLMDSELLIDPVFFYALKKYIPRITHVDVLCKKGKSENELTLFRYDVVLHIEKDEEIIEAISYNWEKDNLNFEFIKDILENKRPQALRILDVPSNRMAKLTTEIDVLSNEIELKTVGEVVAEVDIRLKNNGVEFEKFMINACSEYDVEMLWAGTEKDNYYNVVFLRKDVGGKSKRKVFSDLCLNLELDYPLGRFTNVPLKAKYLKNFVGNLKNYLRKRLPEYMVPSYIVQLKYFPLTSNGKVDKKALPEPNVNKLIFDKYEEPKNKTETKLVEIWCRVLGVDKIGINNNFFELGGHSLNATAVISEIHKELNVEVPLRELFRNPTIKELSVYMEKSIEDAYETIDICEDKDFYETSSAQKRMYTIQQLKKSSTAYNMTAVYEVVGEIDCVGIEETFNKLVQRHEALRTYFETIDGEIVQKIDKEYEFKLEIIKDLEKEFEEIIEDFIMSFDLNKAPLFRAKLIETSQKRYLLIDMHHIISDGISVSIFIKEFSKLYNGIEMAPQRLQYKDFAKWQNKLMKSEKIKKQKDYWFKKFSEEIPVLNLPYDNERTLVQNFEGDNIYFSLDEETTSSIRTIAMENESTIHMVLLSVFNILLSKYSGQDRIVVGIPVAGRLHSDVYNIMGMFVNTLALVNNTNTYKTFKEFLKEVNENSVEAYENQSFQFEELLDVINVKREQSRNPLFDVMFNMIDADYTKDIELDGLKLKPYKTKNKISKFDLTLTAIETSSKIEMNFEYSTSLFKKNTIEKAVKDIKLIIDVVLKNTDIELGKICLRSEEEQQYILQEAEYIKNIKGQDFDF